MRVGRVLGSSLRSLRRFLNPKPFRDLGQCCTRTSGLGSLRKTKTCEHHGHQRPDTIAQLLFAQAYTAAPTCGLAPKLHGFQPTENVILPACVLSHVSDTL